MEKEQKNNQQEGPMSAAADVTTAPKAKTQDAAEQKNAGKNVATTANSKPAAKEEAPASAESATAPKARG